MDTQTTIALLLIGAAAVAAGVVGILLPPGERIAAALPLVVGAGVGVATLAIGTNGAEDSDTIEDAFLTASILGFAATAVTLELLWLRSQAGTRRGETARPHDDAGGSLEPSDPSGDR